LNRKTFHALACLKFIIEAQDFSIRITLPIVSEMDFVEKLKEEIEVIGRHLRILKIIVEEGPIGIIRLSEITGLPPHKVRYSLRVLEENGLIKPSSNGAVTTEKTEEFINNFRNILNELKLKVEKLEEFVPR